MLEIALKIAIIVLILRVGFQVISLKLAKIDKQIIEEKQTSEYITRERPRSP